MSQPAHPDIDPAAAVASLGVEGASGFERVKGGWETTIWRFGTPDGRSHSLRVYPLPDHGPAVRNDTIALRHCEAVGLPAPRLEAEGRVQELPALVLSWCPGKPLLSVFEQKPWRVHGLSHMFGRAQARLHAKPPPPGMTAGAPENWARMVPPEMQHLADGVLALGPSTTAFIHMDYHPGNLIVDGGQVTGIVDWAGAAAGDPRADLARTAVTLETAPMPKGPMKAVYQSMRSIMLAGWKAGYRAEAGGMPDYTPFKRWAAATLLREVERLIGLPGVWGGPEFVEELRRYAERP
jgi:aminoglycoside phosphotransferase (APT) family kinase protein